MDRGRTTSVDEEVPPATWRCSLYAGFVLQSNLIITALRDKYFD